MSQSHFIVCQRNDAWQHTNRGSVSAPFKTREEAVQSAIEDARNSGDADAEVIVQEPDTQTHTVWRSGGETEDTDQPRED
ncbi:hypothetical protein VW35_16150 [Devosia soli]|uniref:DUF2188 domain-containing protein n=1 Tax=Devosia soli TaxID=361041 RepID=A0A0F5L3H4_9HYPH|nr:DUF2188 domain-containing protein [Devosia soli]KKB76918.1 hypothetical protein VW35_16150 [Devosia soli]